MVSVVIVLGVLNYLYEVIAFHPFFDVSIDSVGVAHPENKYLKVMTWNVHCSMGADSVRQRQIARVILQENVDFVLLNEFYQDSCGVLDSLLKKKFPYTMESHSHQKCGDIFYSKRELANTGKLSLYDFWRNRLSHCGEAYPDSLNGKTLSAIRATIVIGTDSVQIFGMHLPSNSGDGSAIINSVDSLTKIDSYYLRYKKNMKERAFQARWVAKYINESSHPVIVMGDMNDFSRSKPLNIYRSCGLKDSWWEGGLGYGSTFHGGWYRLRIDYILYSPARDLKGLKLISVKVVRTEWSDHNPIVASFSMKSKSTK